MVLLPARVSISAEWLERKLQGLKGRVFPPAATRADLRGQILADHTIGVRAGIIAEKVGLVLQNELVSAARRMRGSDFTVLVQDLLAGIDERLALIVPLYGYPAYIPTISAVHIHCDPVLEAIDECATERAALVQLLKAGIPVTYYTSSDAVVDLYSILERDGLTSEERSRIAFGRREKAWRNPVVVIENETPLGLMAATCPSVTKESGATHLRSRLPRDWMQPVSPTVAARWLQNFKAAQTADVKEA